MESNKIKILIDNVFNIQFIPNIEENIVTLANNFLQETINNLDKIDYETILNKFCLTLLHEADNLKTDISKIHIFELVYLPINWYNEKSTDEPTEKNTDEFNDFIIYLYSKYEFFRNSFNDVNEYKNICLINNFMDNKKYIDFVFEIIPHNTYAKKVILEKYFYQNKLTYKQKQIILRYVTESFDKFIDVIPTEEDINYIIRKYNFYKLLVENGKIIPSIKHLEIACEVFSTDCYTNDTLVIYIMDHKVFPNRKCLEYIINAEMCEYDNATFDENYIRNNSVFKRVINVFYNLGIEFTKDDIVKLTSKKICIENFKDYDLLTTEFFVNCIREKFYPPYICKCKLTINCYYYIFSHIKIITLPDYVQELLSDCNLICLRLASCIPDNLETIKFILEKNINTDKETIRKIIGEDNCVKLKDILRNYK